MHILWLMGTEKRTFTVPEAAEQLGVSAWSLYERIRNEDFPHLRLGRRLLIPKDAIDALCKAPPDSAPAGAEALILVRERLMDVEVSLSRLADAIDAALKDT